MRSPLLIASVLAVTAVSGTASAVFEDYENLSEGFLGSTFSQGGVTYRDVNNVTGAFPDGNPFTQTDLGDQLIIERAVPLYDDFPTYGSPSNGLTFGNAFVVGDNLSIGALASVWMDLDEVSNAASFDIAFYENGPWGGIEYRLEAVRNGNVVDSDSYTLANGGGRDNPAFTTLSVTASEFDSLHLYAWFNGGYTAPRGIIDNLSVQAVPEPATLVALGLGGLALMRRRRR